MIRLKANFGPEYGPTPPMAARLSNSVEQFSSIVTLEFGEKRVRMDSLIGLLSVIFQRGQEICIVAEGDDEIEAAHSIRDILEDKAS